MPVEESTVQDDGEHIRVAMSSSGQDLESKGLETDGLRMIGTGGIGPADGWVVDDGWSVLDDRWSASPGRSSALV